MILPSPIEHYLPFSFLQLPVTSTIVIPYIRKFQPADDDHEIHMVMMDSSLKQTEQDDDDDFGFMEGDDDFMMTENMVGAALSTSPFSVARAH